MTAVWGNQETKFFHSIDPDTILRCVDELGFNSTGRVLALNALENRVYEVEINNPDTLVAAEKFIIIKFYRPGRWSKEQIQEEHDFLLKLVEKEIPVIAPICINGQTLFSLIEHGIFYALFPKQGGRNTDEFDDETLQRIGRTLGRIHQVGSNMHPVHRLRLNPENYGLQNLAFLTEKKLISANLELTYAKTVEQICWQATEKFRHVAMHAIHGDCHRGNILWRPEALYILDFDDMVIGPAVQDIWLLLPGRDAETCNMRNTLINAYEDFFDFDDSSLQLVESLRALRFIHFSAWIGKRYEDQSFQRAFPHYGTEAYWREQTDDLIMQLRLIKNNDE